MYILLSSLFLSLSLSNINLHSHLHMRHQLGARDHTTTVHPQICRGRNKINERNERANEKKRKSENRGVVREKKLFAVIIQRIIPQLQLKDLYIVGNDKKIKPIHKLSPTHFIFPSFSLPSPLQFCESRSRAEIRFHIGGLQLNSSCTVQHHLPIVF